MRVMKIITAALAAATIALSIVSAAAPASASASTVAYGVPVGGPGGLHSNFVHAKVRPSRQADLDRRRQRLVLAHALDELVPLQREGIGYGAR